MSDYIDTAADGSVHDEVYTAVRSAIWRGWNVNRFMESAEAAWEEVLREDLAAARRAFEQRRRGEAGAPR